MASATQNFLCFSRPQLDAESRSADVRPQRWMLPIDMSVSWCQRAWKSKYGLFPFVLLHILSLCSHFLHGLGRVTYERDMKIMNAASFTIQREDHTIGNIVRMWVKKIRLLFYSYQWSISTHVNLKTEIILWKPSMHTSIGSYTGILMFYFLATSCLILSNIKLSSRWVAIYVDLVL